MDKVNQIHPMLGSGVVAGPVEVTGTRFGLVILDEFNPVGSDETEGILLPYSSATSA